MRKQFLVTWDGTLEADPETVWYAITAGTAGWLWEIDYEPREGGAERGLTDRGTVARWQPPRELATSASFDDGVNQLSWSISAADGGSRLRLEHVGLAEVDDYGLEVDACQRHTDFYYHSLGQYLRHFAGGEPLYVAAEAPGPSAEPGSGDRLRAALGLSRATAVGRPVRLEVPGLPPVVGEVDYHTEAFLGVLADSGLYRFYLRDHWGWPVGLAHHVFDDRRSGAEVTEAWGAWLTGVFSGARIT